MRFRVTLFLLAILSLSALLVGCQERQVTQFLMEVTREVTREVTVVVMVTENGTQAISSATPPPSATAIATNSPIVATPTTDTLNPSVASMPTPIVTQIIVAEQVFENGRMFYIQPQDEIWVMIYADEAGTSGQWRFYPNSWEDGMTELDTSIAPPEGQFQPERGFGKLWRENVAVRDALGWALDTEYGLVTNYEFHAGGMISNNEYVAGPGYHILTNRDGFNYVFQQSDGTWQQQP